VKRRESPKASRQPSPGDEPGKVCGVEPAVVRPPDYYEHEDLRKETWRSADGLAEVTTVTRRTARYGRF
jgi:hypothetical protein